MKKELTQKQINWFNTQVSLNGFRKTAFNLMNQFIMNRTGMHLSDLPDSVLLCDALDELESIIEQSDYLKALNEANYYCAEMIDTIMD